MLALLLQVTKCFEIRFRLVTSGLLPQGVIQETRDRYCVDADCYKGGVRQTRAVAQRFLPGFQIPEPPSRRLEEITSASSGGSSDSDSDNSSSGTRSEELELTEATERSQYFGVSDGRSTAGTSIVSDGASESHGDASGGSDSSSEEVTCPLIT